MMRLSTMLRVDRTIDDAGASPVAEAILARWPHDPGSARFFRSSANVLYVFHHQDERRFLRFAAAEERDRRAIEAEIRLLGHLAAAGLDVVPVIQSTTGQSVETIATAWGEFHAVVFAAMEGEGCDLDDLGDSGFRTWGAALGELHAALGDLPEAVAAARPALGDVVAAAGEFVPAGVRGVRDEFARLSSSLASLPITPATYGPIHGDFELDNLVWRDGRVGMLDFDGSLRGWYAADIACALRDLFDAGADLDHPMVRAFLDGYGTHRRLADDDRAQISLFSRVARFLTYASIARALDLPVDSDHPAWLNGLIERLQVRMAAYAASVTA